MTDSMNTKLEMTISDKRVAIDAEIAPLVYALNAAGMTTIASCSGHGFGPGRIALKDGREVIIARNAEEADKINVLFSHDISGRIKA